MKDTTLKYNNTTGMTSLHLRSKYRKDIDNPATIIENTKTSNGLIIYLTRTALPTLEHLVLQG